MDPDQLSVAELADLLREAERAHGEFEKTLGRRDEDWPSWYADYMLKKLRERGSPPLREPRAAPERPRPSWRRTPRRRRRGAARRARR